MVSLFITGSNKQRCQLSICNSFALVLKHRSNNTVGPDRPGRCDRAVDDCDHDGDGDYGGDREHCRQPFALTSGGSFAFPRGDALVLRDNGQAWMRDSALFTYFSSVCVK